MTDIDWRAVERLPEFRQLATGRRRFAWVAGSIGIGIGALYVVLVATAPGLMGTTLVGSFSLGFAGGAGLVLITWAITLAYVRRSARVWGPLEARVRERVLAGDLPAAVPAPAPTDRGQRLGDPVLAAKEVRR